MLVNLEVQRFDPERDSAPHVQTFTVEVAGGATVLEALMQIKDENDGSLSFRRSCRSAICGSCTMSMNGLDVGSSRVDLQACKLEYSIVSPK